MGKNQDKIKEAISRIESGLDTINTNEDWLAYLNLDFLIRGRFV